MPALQIDGQKISIEEEGRTILDAARQAGIEIPTLCWYPMLSIVGNCRICLVSVEGQPKLIPACATKVADGLVVTTRDRKSTRLNSSHGYISYAVFCLKKKKKNS